MNQLRTILLIDDEQIMHDLASAYLERAGFRLISAYTGEAGLKAILKERPDVILLDYMMPGMNGEKVFHALQRDPAYAGVRDIPVIFLTARGSDDGLKQRLIKRGITAYLQKPFGLRELSNIIDNVFIVTDIRTSNKKLRRHVRATRDYLLNIVKNAPVGILSASRQGEIRQINQHALKLMEEMQVRFEYKMSVFDEPLQKTFFCHGVRQVLETGKPWKRPLLHWTVYGVRNLILNVHFVPLSFDSDQEVEGVIGIVEDVSEKARKNLEMAMLAHMSAAMQIAESQEDLLRVPLTTLCAGHALGLTRAIIFLIDDSMSRLTGEVGVGPGNSQALEEMKREWLTRGFSIEKYLSTQSFTPHPASSQLHSLVRGIRIPLSSESPLVQSMLRKQAYRSQDAGNDPLPEGLQELGLADFIAVPLVSQERLLGMVIVDNKFSNVPIQPEQEKFVSLVASHTATAMERSVAFNQLAEEKAKLERALQELQLVHARLVHSERLAAIGEMAAHVAHEIRNPLVTIGGFARQLLQKSSPEADITEPANIIAEEVTRLEKILANILNFTKLPRPKIAPAEINDLIRSVCEQVARDLDQHKIRLKVKLEEQLPQFPFDKQQLRQVLINLMNNSKQAINGEGMVFVETAHSGDMVRITITDTGCGIQQEYLEAIFNPFYTTREHGTGLGLAISQQIIHDHGGEIRVASKIGKGTTFTIYLPVDIAIERHVKDVETLHEMII